MRGVFTGSGLRPFAVCFGVWGYKQYQGYALSRSAGPFAGRAPKVVERDLALM